MKLPTCPEVCQSCVVGSHIMHVISELADVTVSLSSRREGEKPVAYKIEGNADMSSFPGDPAYWLRSIVYQASAALEKTKLVLKCDVCGYGNHVFQEGDPCPHIKFSDGNRCTGHLRFVESEEP
jgi:hypothetical protein